MSGLLDGIVVLDLCHVLAGPYAAMIMADMGATVIKIENPNGGDDTRKWDLSLIKKEPRAHTM